MENSGPINELFPSFNSISEIRVSETNNNAEYSGVADVTTTSRAGTNEYHGGVFENLENTALTAGNPFTGKPALHMNNFGGFAGGPVRIPHLYNGRDKTFFFGSYEGLRLPRQFPLVESFPSLDMRNGNLWNYLSAQQGTSDADDQQLRWHADSLHRSFQLLGSGISCSGQYHQVPDALAQQRQRRLLPEQLCRSTSQHRFRATSSMCASIRTLLPSSPFTGGTPSRTAR